MAMALAQTHWLPGLIGQLRPLPPLPGPPHPRPPFRGTGTLSATVVGKETIDGLSASTIQSGGRHRRA